MTAASLKKLPCHMDFPHFSSLPCLFIKSVFAIDVGIHHLGKWSTLFYFQTVLFGKFTAYSYVFCSILLGVQKIIFFIYSLENIVFLSVSSHKSWFSNCFLTQGYVKFSNLFWLKAILNFRNFLTQGYTLFFYKNVLDRFFQKIKNVCKITF